MSSEMPEILAHRRIHAKSDYTKGGKGYPSCGCCGVAVQIKKRRHGMDAAVFFPCRCQNFQARCGRCHRCPDHCSPACRGEEAA